MNFTPEQKAAFARIEQWLRSPTTPQVFRLFGYAGTGKTTMAREMARGRPGVVFGAFTGKAASVMRAKGCHDASTIHAMIYRRIADDVTNRPIFVLNEEGPAARASLIIIDECSMVDRRLGEDLLSFDRRVLVLGDPAQLPPVQGAGFFTAASPDVLLTEIHRQAAGSPIIALADRVRRGGALKASQDRGSRILDARQLDADTVLGADQILVGRNLTRNRINARVRELRGRRGTHPVAGDKLVCLRNNHQRGILNGEIWFVSEVLEPEVPDVLRLALRSDDGSAPSEISVLDLVVSVHRALFEGVPYKPTAAQQRELDEFTYGYALTVHKAQGSQWNNVLLFDESDVFRSEAPRHLYTGLTRAAETITVVLP